MGAGVIPFAVHKQQLYFLFQTVFVGRKAGFYIDFGGGIDSHETPQQAAAREFIEETETLFFSQGAGEITHARRTPERIAQQLQTMTRQFEKTLTEYPHWWCHREPGNKIPPKDWVSFFIEVKYQDLTPFNREWEKFQPQISTPQRFKKRRQLHWLEADELLSIYQNCPEKLWKRVRQLMNVQALIREIKEKKSSNKI